MWDGQGEETREKKKEQTLGRHGCSTMLPYQIIFRILWCISRDKERRRVPHAEQNRGLRLFAGCQDIKAISQMSISSWPDGKLLCTRHRALAQSQAVVRQHPEHIPDHRRQTTDQARRARPPRSRWPCQETRLGPKHLAQTIAARIVRDTRNSINAARAPEPRNFQLRHFGFTRNRGHFAVEMLVELSCSRGACCQTCLMRQN